MKVCLSGARNVPLPTLVDGLDALDRGRPTVVYCAGGYRSAVAASVLRAAGFDDVSDILGGYGAWSAAGLPVTAADEKGTTMSPDTVPDVSAEEGRHLVDEGALLLDVREADEWDAGHSPEATWIPLGEVPDRLGDLPRDRKIVAICRSGGRSRAVAGALIGAGYDVVNVDGGMRAWMAEDYDVVAADGLPGVVV